MLTVSSLITLGFLCCGILTKSAGTFCKICAWVVVNRAPLLQTDLPGQILLPVESPDEVNHHEGVRICLYRSTYNKWLEFVNNMNNEDHLADLFVISIPDNLCFTFVMVLLNVYFLCYLFMCLYFK